jgi:autophagy-related protein 11
MPLLLNLTQIIYVFNKQYLDLDPQEAIDALHVDPPLQPPIDGASRLSLDTQLSHVRPETTVSTPPVRASHISTAYLRAAHMHLASAKHVVHAMQHQAGALRSSFGALDLRALSLGDAFEELGLAARREAGRQATLLAGVDADLALVSRVAVHPAFLSPVVRAALAAGERPRTLGDYVSSAKMRQVADTCARTHGERRCLCGGLS